MNVYAIPNVYLTFTVKTQSNYLSADIKKLRYEKKHCLEIIDMDIIQATDYDELMKNIITRSL